MTDEQIAALLEGASALRYRAAFVRNMADWDDGYFLARAALWEQHARELEHMAEEKERAA